MTRQLDNSLYRYSQRSAGTINYDINGLNQIDYILSGDNFTYDTDGNLTDIGTTDDYAYDDRHRLTETPAGTGITYGADGNLDTLTTARQFTYDGTNITIERNAGDAIVYRYVHTGGLGAPALRLSGTGNTTQEFYLTDERGSVIAATNTSGARAYINTYDEYGVEGTGNSGLYGYTGQVRLGDNSLTHNRNRAYHAGIGRFLQTDPIGQDGGINLYAYVGGDPMNYWDPTGNVPAAYCYHHDATVCLRNDLLLQLYANGMDPHLRDGYFEMLGSGHPYGDAILNQGVYYFTSTDARWVVESGCSIAAAGWAQGEADFLFMAGSVAEGASYASAIVAAGVCARMRRNPLSCGIVGAYTGILTGLSGSRSSARARQYQDFSRTCFQALNTVYTRGY